jgi:Uma2 family endonuclease
MEYRIRLGRSGEFDHNVYVTCKKLEKTHYSIVKADGISIDFILEILSIHENI